MAVVINDFEVVPPAPRDDSESQAGAPETDSAQAEQLARSIEQRLRVRRERKERLDAT